MKKTMKFLAKVLCTLCILAILAVGAYVLFINIAGISYKDIAAVYDQNFSSWNGDAYGVYQEGNDFYCHAEDYKIKLVSPSSTSWIEEGLDETDSEQKLFAGKFQYLDSRKYLSDVSKEQALLLATTMFESEDLSEEDYAVLKSNLITILNACSLNPIWYGVRNLIELNF